MSIIWTSLTIGCYLIGIGLRRLSGDNSIANPAMVAIVLVAVLVKITHTPYVVYLHSTLPLTLLLAPATVALGIPLAKYAGQVRQSFGAVLGALLAGSLLSMVSGMMLVRVLGGSRQLALSMLPKAATTPIAMSISDQIGGLPALTAALAIIGGVVAAVSLSAIQKLLGVMHGQALGLAAGTAGSGVAAAHVVRLGEIPTAFAAIGIGVNGLLTAIAAPWIAKILLWQ